MTLRCCAPAPLMPRFRPFTWIILVINVIFLIWIIVGASSTSPSCPPGLDPAACILGILWLITRPRRRECPACGYAAKRGVTVCQHCDRSFA